MHMMESVLGLPWNAGNVEQSAFHEILFMETSEFLCQLLGLLYFPPGFQWGVVANGVSSKETFLNGAWWYKNEPFLLLWEKREHYHDLTHTPQFSWTL